MVAVRKTHCLNGELVSTITRTREASFSQLRGTVTCVVGATSVRVSAGSAPLSPMCTIVLEIRGTTTVIDRSSRCASGRAETVRLGLSRTCGNGSCEHENAHIARWLTVAPFGLPEVPDV